MVSREDRVKYYAFEKYMTHINGCKGGGDQMCACGMASVRWNVADLLDEPEEAPCPPIRPADEPAVCQHEWHNVIDVCKDRPCTGSVLGRKCVRCGLFDGTYKNGKP